MLILFHLLSKLNRTEMPTAPIVTAKATLIPAMYAIRIPSSSSTENTLCSSVAPVATTRAGLTLGAVLGSLFKSWLTKPDCAAPMRNAPPTVSKTADEGYH